MFKIATWNINSLRLRLDQVVDWLNTQQPDILALQETKTPDSDFPQQALLASGYYTLFTGQKAYNGVALLSRTPASETIMDLPDVSDPQRRIIAATIAGIRCVNVYVPNGQALDSDKYLYKLEWLSKLADYLQQQLTIYPHLVLMGDFNIAPEDRDVYDPALWAGKLHCSEPERAALKKIFALELQDAFRLFAQPEQSFSWWDYRAGGFQRNRGLRIDLILINTKLATYCTACWIDKKMRELAKPSDHAPVIAEFAELFTS